MQDLSSFIDHRHLISREPDNWADKSYATIPSSTYRRMACRPKCSLPLDGFGSAASSFQLRPVFAADSNRVPPSNTMSCFVGSGDKSRDNFRNFFQTQGFEFLFLSQRPRLAAFGGSIAPKTPVLKLNRPLARKPPAAIASESTQVACRRFAKPQVAGTHHR